MEQIIVGIASLIILPMFYRLLIRWKEKEEKKISYKSEFMIKPSKGLTLFFFIFMIFFFLGMVGAVLFYCLTKVANKNVIFLQSENEYHANISWLLECLTPYGELSRMTQFKD